MTRDRDGLPWPARLALRWLVAADRRASVEGDLLELRAIRRAEGRRDLRRALLRDLASIAWAMRRREIIGVPLNARQRSDQAQRGRGLLQDLRYALRLIRRQPMSAALVAGTLTIGIAASTAIFSICDRVLVKPLAYPEPDRLFAAVNVGLATIGNSMGLAPDVAALPVFAGAGVYATGGLNLGDESRPLRLRAAAAEAGFFAALDVPPAMGRTFDRDEARDAARVVVLGFDLWTRAFNQDRAVVGREIRLNSQRFVVVGVMPRGFTFPGDTEAWIPPFADHQLTGEAFAPRAVIRLARGVTVDQALGELTRWDEARHAKNPQRRLSHPELTPLRQQLVSGVRPTLLFLASVVGLLLVATCASVAGLVLSRLRVRQRELVVRVALGADRLRLARQLVTESLVLTTIGGVGGLAIGQWAIRLFAAAVPAFLPGLDLATVDVRFFIVGLAVTVFCGLVCALAPLSSVLRTPLAQALREATTMTRRRRWFSGGLVAAQMAVALVLLTATSATLGAVLKLVRVDLGFRNEGAVVFELTLPRTRYPNGEAIAAFVQAFETRMQRRSARVHVGATNLAPGSSQIGLGAGFTIAGQAPPEDAANRYALMLSATPDYFRTLGIPVIAGRAFTISDRAKSAPVVILSESAAHFLWPHAPEAIGQRLSVRDGRRVGGATTEAEVVGIVGDVRLRGLAAELDPQLYYPLAQDPPVGSIGIAVDGDGDRLGLVSSIRDALHDVDPELPFYNAEFVAALQARFLKTERLTLTLTGIFATVGLVLSALGLYGVLAQMVAQRTRELGIRMALGADRSRLRRSVVFAGLRVTIVGVAIGGGVAILAARLIATFVPALQAPQLAAVGIDALVLLSVALLASWVPARRASAVNPIVALRND